MPALLKVAAATLNQTPMDWEGNRNTIVAAIRKAEAEDIDLLCLPELCISGYGCEDAFFSNSLQETAWQMLLEILPEIKRSVVSLGLPVYCRGALYNCACLVAQGEILGFQAKKYLAGDGIHYEPRWFKAWAPNTQVTLNRDGAIFPFGDIYFDLHGVRIGYEICEEAWVAERPGINLSSKAVDIILNPSASHFAFGKHEVRKRFSLEGSRAFGVVYIYSNLLGCEAGRIIYDGDCLIAASGKMLTEGPRFSYKEFSLSHTLVDLDTLRMARSRGPNSRSTAQNNEERCISRPQFRFINLGKSREKILSSVPTHAASVAWETSPQIKKEEFSRAVALGLFDYMRKSRSRGFVVSLSGGADSSAASCLVAQMAERAVKELGLSQFIERLSYSDWLKGCSNYEQVNKHLLCCVYQPTRNSSQTTKDAASTLARALGAQYYEFEVDDFVDNYVDLVARKLARPLDWKTDDLALQNVQARARVPGLWLLTNILGALLLTTSNRSEAAVGYATMDGDTSGGLCPLGGIDKAFLREWLRWVEVDGPHGERRLPELSLVTSQEPTAELRPLSDKQTDERDLMPYEVLDYIERLAIRDKKDPIEAFQILIAELAGKFSKADLYCWVKKFFRLWALNQWKRERYAPSFHLDDENLDPKTWCRFPILSGGYAHELAALDTYYQKLLES